MRLLLSAVQSHDIKVCLVCDVVGRCGLVFITYCCSLVECSRQTWCITAALRVTGQVEAQCIAAH